ncbi:MAG TPA: hypothetical protein P5121_23770 [Caldilineaceae bacterium]|nr:hypothetical protein [Caldilineaceae bacterium]
MYTLESVELSVSILDPVVDQERLGSRYCVGGYIYQVTDPEQGELLTGPQYPDPYPDTFDGQGAPDMFFTPLGAEETPVGGDVGIIGVGLVRRTSPIEPFYVRHNPEVSEFLAWEVEASAAAITMRTTQTFRDWAYRLSRQVTLDGRTVHSETSIENTGEAILPVRWFAHPFFPLTPDRVYSRFSIPVSMPENEGYFINDDQFICQKPDYSWPRGFYQALTYEKPTGGITITQKHPTVGAVITTTDFAPDYLPVWSNANTFSFEPYFAAQLAQGEATAWRISYQF